jgi:hypothetical protein
MEAILSWITEHLAYFAGAGFLASTFLAWAFLAKAQKASDRYDAGLPVIKTSYVCPPIPLCGFDWCAFEDGHEEDGPFGYGATAMEAIADLRSQIEERRA